MDRIPDLLGRYLMKIYMNPNSAEFGIKLYSAGGVDI